MLEEEHGRNAGQSHTQCRAGQVERYTDDACRNHKQHGSECPFGSSVHLRSPVDRSCGPHLRFGGTFYFTRRIGATFNLLQAGTIRYLPTPAGGHLPVVGDNGTRYYDDPNDMRDALLAAGVSDDRIALDYTVFHPLESVILAREVFGWVPTRLATTWRSSASSSYSFSTVKERSAMPAKRINVRTIVSRATPQ
ncbi:MAG: hypothetical protein P1P84_24720 [Deferrisomatales bacterium]|nr:hypothetical protein [Deferrisomatales bacterium]